MTPKQFCKKYGVKVKGEFFDTVDGEWPHTEYKATLKYKGGDAWSPKLKFRYRMGLAHTDFNPMGALYAVGTDASAGEYYFEYFCDEFGSDPDSIEVRDTWKACRKLQRKAYAFCKSQEMYEDLKTLEY